MNSDLIVYNPLDDELPSDPVDGIHRLARDLAWGALNNLWPARIEIRGGRLTAAKGPNGGLLYEYLGRWGNQLPDAHLLLAFGYLEEHQSETPSGVKMTVGDVTLAAFALIKKPVRTPRVYISYHREYSSAFALLLAARMQRVGIENPLLDMTHNPGDLLHAEQARYVVASDFVVVLIAPGTLDAPYIQAEITWALGAPDAHLIPVWHAGFTPAHDYPPELATRSSVRVKTESAAAYNSAVVSLLNRLGYAP